MKLTALVFLAGMAGLMAAEKVETLRLEPAPNMTRAELHHVFTVPNPKAVLVLCPGCNGSGEDLIRSPEWIAFAKQNRLGLVGLSFASPMPAIEDGTGYYYASKGSGAKLLEGIRKIYGRDLPLLFYGFSGGAHFTSRFEEWRPDRILAWCAYSAEWWDEPQKSKISPPGIVACGEDDSRYGATLIYFKQGRAIGKPWLWVSLAKTGHEGSPKLGAFVREFFSMILNDRQDRSGIFADIDRKTEVDEAFVRDFPSLTGCLPDITLLDAWRTVHSP